MREREEGSEEGREEETEIHTVREKFRDDY